MNALTRSGFATVGLAAMLIVSPVTVIGTEYSYPQPSIAEGVTSPYDVPTADTIGPARLRSERYGSSALIAPDDRYGTPAGNMSYDREIRLGPGTRTVSVAHNEVVKFVAANGHEFRWKFDTLRQLDAFPLARIAPADVPTSPNVTVYVNEGEIRVNG
ncbi:MAG TPA: CzcE family metal-binding protein [Burkholderiales bacterium]|nr:CzcE family metal-binding protein [Burkholderiales bacterium]